MVMYFTALILSISLKVSLEQKKWRKDTIKAGDGPLRGLMPLRKLYYRVNESKIPATTRMGMTNSP